MEIWKDVPGYNGLYQVSSEGNIISLNYAHLGISKVMAKTKRRKGYYGTVLTKNKIRKSYFIHQIVAMAFLNHKPDGMKLVINHIDHDKTNNKTENLEIVTNRQNASHRKYHGSCESVGVHYVKDENKYSSWIYDGNKNRYIGYYKTEEEAKSAYNKALTEINQGQNITFTPRITSSKYVGVTFHKRDKKYYASCRTNNKLKHIGVFKNEIDAVNAYLSYKDSISTNLNTIKNVFI